MKKIIFIIFTFISINAFADMNHHMEGRHHHKKHYMKKIYENDDLTNEQKEEFKKLRMEFINEDRKLNSQLRELRKDMNHCMRSDSDNKDEEYERLRDERERLRKEKRALENEFKTSLRKIIKKQ